MSNNNPLQSHIPDSTNPNPNKKQSYITLIVAIIVSLFVGGTFVYFIQNYFGTPTTDSNSDKNVREYIKRADEAQASSISVEKEKSKLDAAVKLMEDVQSFSHKAVSGVTQAEAEQMRTRFNSFINEMEYPERLKWHSNDLSDFTRKASDLVDYVISQKR